MKEIDIDVYQATTEHHQDVDGHEVEDLPVVDGNDAEDLPVDIPHMAIMASNSHIAIWPLWRQRWPYGCFWKQQYKYSNLVKTVSQFNHPASNESKNGPVSYFPLYF